MIFKMLHRKLKIKQQESTLKNLIERAGAQQG